MQPQQEERVGKVDQAEQGQHRDDLPVAALELAGACEEAARPVHGVLAAAFTDRGDQQHAENGGDDGHPQQGTDTVIEQLVARQPEQRADHGTEGVGRPVEPERAADRSPGHALNEQPVSGSAAHSLAEPVQDPPAQHERPGRRQRDHQLAHSGQPIADTDQRPAVEPVPEEPRGQLGQARRALRETLHHTDHGNRGAENHGQEDRQDRVEQLTRRVLQQRHPRQHLEVVRQPPAFRCHAGGHFPIHPPTSPRSVSAATAR